LPVYSFVYLFCLFVFLSSCHSKKPQETAVTKKAEIVVIHPISPSIDSLKNGCSMSFSDLEVSHKTADRNYDSFSFQNSAFSGWACQTFEGKARKYKFNHFKNGKSIRQVAYFVNGAIESDNYLDWSQGFASERSWMANGKPFTENYYSSPATRHGLQRKWFSNGLLAKETLYDNGLIIYELEYNREGELIISKGAVPSNKLK
jgi:hypothetical protein